MVLQALIEELGAEESNLIKTIEAALSSEELESLRVKAIGKKGSLTKVLRGMGKLSPDDRPKLGAAANQARDRVNNALEHAKKRLENAALEAELKIQLDLSEPSAGLSLGSSHPIMQVQEEILSVMDRLGFQRAEGPEIEHDFYNFEALNFPHNHPARDMQDTFFVDENVVLRTHTSPIQIRQMLAQGEPPMHISGYGRVYRHDQDATHSPMFHQIEGLWVDHGVHLGHLKGTITAFLETLFTPETGVRFRPSYFPFTEPSAEVDMSCVMCGGSGVAHDPAANNEHGKCKMCKGTGWIEILGAGMVDPNVFGAVNFPKDIRGFAFGIGVERVAMLKYGISDIRMFYENDHRFLSQF